MKVDPTLIHRLFYPQVPAVLSASYEGRVSAMPVVSYSVVSDSPPIVAVGCNPDSFTCKLAIKSRSFSLSLLDYSKLLAIEKLAQVHGSKVKDKLVAAGLTHSKGTVAQAPVIAGSQATLECKLRRTLKTGDHILLIGEVLSAQAGDAFSGFWDFRKYSPILYTGWKENGMATFPD